MISKPFKVIIAGGSIAGLSLALMLEKNGIDFVVLEAYPSIAPQVGASIGVLPNGLRILDQLGCCDEVVDMAEYPVEKVLFRDSAGQMFWSLDDFGREIVDCHGYPVVFLDRRMLIQILYDKIEDKSKVLTSEKVVTIENTLSHVTVTTQTGNYYTGDIVIGADGIHSTVRKQMWQEAQRTDPTWIDPSEEKALPATYACVFGISKGVPGIEKGTLSSVLNEHTSYLIPSGPGDRTYWFLVRNLGKTMYGSDIPRFTKPEEEALVKEHWDDYVTPLVRFSDLYKHKISSVYTSLPEYVYKKWYFQRIMTIGDASHKPITGQGGNNAIETAASLINHLKSALHASSSRPLSTEEISTVFKKVQQQRYDRVCGLVKASHRRQRLECMETPTLKFIAKYIFPLIPKQVMRNQWIQTYCPAVSLNMLSHPNRPRKIPYHDELLRVPVSRGWLGFAVYTAYIILAWIAFRLLFVAMEENGTQDLIRDIFVRRVMTEKDIPLRQNYIGFQGIDRIMQVLVAMFFSTVTSSSPQQIMQIFYFLSAVLPLITIFTVEGFRPKNKWTLLAVPSLWATLCQLRGIGVIAPLYFLTSAFVSRSVWYYSPLSMELPVAMAKAILPAVLLGYIIPTMLLFFPYIDVDTHQVIIAFWQPAPVLVPILTGMFSCLTKLRAGQCSNGSAKKTKEDTDIPYLTAVYTATGIIAACSHAFVIIGCLVSDEFSIIDVLLRKDSLAPVSNLADGVFVFFQNDCLMTAVAVFLCCMVTVWDLYRVGLSNVTLLGGLGAVIAGFGLVGPGATAAAVWYWREHLLGGRN